MKKINDLCEKIVEQNIQLIEKVNDIQQLCLHLSSRLDKIETAQKPLQNSLLAIETSVEEVLHLLECEEQASPLLVNISYPEIDEIKKNELN